MRKATETMTESMESRLNSWNIFPGFTTLQLCSKVADLLSSLGEEPEIFTRRILFMSRRRGLSQDSLKAKTSTFEVPTGQDTTKIPREDPQERGRNTREDTRREKKRHEKIPRERKKDTRRSPEREKKKKREILGGGRRSREGSRESAQILDAHENFEHTPPPHHTTTQHNTTTTHPQHNDPAQVLGKGGPSQGGRPKNKT